MQSHIEFRSCTFSRDLQYMLLLYCTFACVMSPGGNGPVALSRPISAAVKIHSGKVRHVGLPSCCNPVGASRLVTFLIKPLKQVQQPGPGDCRLGQNLALIARARPADKQKGATFPHLAPHIGRRMSTSPAEAAEILRISQRASTSCSECSRRKTRWYVAGDSLGPLSRLLYPLSAPIARVTVYSKLVQCHADDFPGSDKQLPCDQCVKRGKADLCRRVPHVRPKDAEKYVPVRLSPLTHLCAERWAGS